ncbi:MAG TPA: hypothetical protein VEZ11_10070 [Thermoanaerobaculia bacterium]|nr:hypothetical protein [Thermoanaerobaculia bacterium]
MKRIIALGVLFTALIASPVLAQGSNKIFPVPVPDHGTVRFSIPESWTAEISARPGLPPTVTFKIPDQRDAQLLITILWSPQDDPEFTKPESIKAAIQQASAMIQETAVQSSLAINELRSKSAVGYWFWATDKKPAPGEFEHMANGALPLGDVVMDFTILTHAAPPESLAVALGVVKNATRVAGQ